MQLYYSSEISSKIVNSICSAKSHGTFCSIYTNRSQILFWLKLDCESNFFEFKFPRLLSSNSSYSFEYHFICSLTLTTLWSHFKYSSFQNIVCVDSKFTHWYRNITSKTNLHIGRSIATYNWSNFIFYSYRRKARITNQKK